MPPVKCLYQIKFRILTSRHLQILHLLIYAEVEKVPYLQESAKAALSFPAGRRAWKRSRHDG